MNCNEARQHWNLYHDSEGDAELHFRISEHLGVCPECAEWFAQQSRLESLLEESLRDGCATPAVWKQVLRGCQLRQASMARRWLWLGSMAAALLISVATAFFLMRDRFGSAPDLARLSAEWHEQLASGAAEPDFRSQSDREVESYLRQRVSFSVRCPPRKDAGFAVRGAGVFHLADQPAAYLAGQVQDKPVSIFVLPRESLSAFPHQRDAVAAGQIHRCREGPYEMALAVIDRNAVLVVGETNSDRLVKVLSAYGTYPAHH